MTIIDLQTMLRQHRNAQCARYMALTAAKLLVINTTEHNVALLMGYSSGTNNLMALTDWIECLVEEEAEAADFQNWVFPKLLDHLQHCQDRYCHY